MFDWMLLLYVSRNVMYGELHFDNDKIVYNGLDMYIVHTRIRTHIHAYTLK